MKREILDRLLAARSAKQPVALATELATGAQALVSPKEMVGALSLPDAARAAVLKALQADRSGTIEAVGRGIFVQSFNPPPRLIVVGAVHIAQPLAPMASLAGYGVTVVDPRRAFASDQRFPDVELSAEWPDEALARLKPDARTAVVTLTHDPKLDDPALAAALRSAAFYIGALGSKKTHAARLARLSAEGFGDNELARIHGPVGLAIGAVSPAEIAVSIMAEVTEARHREAAS
ncbi:MAG: XdhC family protein [Proteobacteria bacterium]|nr:XdhC family protein [Pseudomonadota bacterium]MBI3499332.1 XdhC family protein [Pseudomonadota bacterium]